MKILQEHIGEELIGAAQAAEILGVSKSNMAYYLNKEKLTPFRIGAYNLFFLSDVEAVAANIAERALQAQSEKIIKAAEVKLKRGMFEGDIEVEEISPDKFISIWQAGAYKAIPQGELAQLRKKLGVPVYYFKGGRYMLKADLVKIPSNNVDKDLF